MLSVLLYVEARLRSFPMTRDAVSCAYVLPELTEEEDLPTCGGQAQGRAHPPPLCPPYHFL